jgi:hypothetical protein
MILKMIKQKMIKQIVKKYNKALAWLTRGRKALALRRGWDSHRSAGGTAGHVAKLILIIFKNFIFSHNTNRLSKNITRLSFGFVYPRPKG